MVRMKPFSYIEADEIPMHAKQYWVYMDSIGVLSTASKFIDQYAKLN